MATVPKNKNLDSNHNPDLDDDRVQLICDTFLQNPDVHWHPVGKDIFHHSNNRVTKSEAGVPTFLSTYWLPYSSISLTRFQYFTEAEMHEAWRTLLDAGYYMFRTMEVEGWPGYFCSTTPHVDNGNAVRVDSFAEKWWRE